MLPFDIILNHLPFRCSTRDAVVKAGNWWEETVPNMLPREFRRFFHMNDETLENLTVFLATNRHLHKLLVKAISLPEKVAMTCTYLGTSTATTL